MHAIYPGFSRGSVTIAALGVLGGLGRRGGSMRIHALLRDSGLTTDELCDAVNELQERGWVRVRRHTARGNLPERLREVDRVALTHEGRLFAPRFWVARPPRLLSADGRPRPDPSTG